jgi:hypothetical protein
MRSAVVGRPRGRISIGKNSGRSHQLCVEPRHAHTSTCSASADATKFEYARSSAMTSYKDPSFQDRTDQAAVQKEKALERLRGRPELDEVTVSLRKAAGARREAAQAEKVAAKKATAEARAQSKAAAKAKAAAPIATDADRKAARDARYAARQARNKR